MKKYTPEKIRGWLWRKLVVRTRKTVLYPYIYRSYWYQLINSSSTNKSKVEQNQYFAARPNPGAGIGHQMANWIAGFWWAKQFDKKFAHMPFSSAQWEDFLGFGAQELTVKDLLSQGYQRVLLPLFEEKNEKEVLRVQKIIASYAGKQIVFVCEADQFYRDQYGVIDDVQDKFYAAPSRKYDKLMYTDATFNIAIHVRRGDIVIGQETKNSNLLMRYQSNDYFYNVLSATLQKVVRSEKPTAIYLFSQGEEKDFEDFKDFPNLHFCLDMNAQNSFLHMVYADLLITSKSSFSYKPALMSKGIKVSPQNFWHKYPDREDWILADDDGQLKL